MGTRAVAQFYNEFLDMGFTSVISSGGDRRGNGLHTGAEKTGQFFHRTLGALLGATALANLANGVGLLDEAHALFWREIAMVAELAQPAALLYVGLAFLNPAERRVNSSMLWPARITGFVGLLLAALAMTGHVFQLKTFEDGQAAIGLAAWGPYPLCFYCDRDGFRVG